MTAVAAFTRGFHRLEDTRIDLGFRKRAGQWIEERRALAAKSRAAAPTISKEKALMGHGL